MTDLESNDWTEDDRVFNADVEATLKADNVCIRPWPNGLACCRGYDHTGLCVPVPTAVSAPGGQP